VCYLSIVQMDGAGGPPVKPEMQRKHAMYALTRIGRLFDVVISIAFVGISLTLAGATAAFGA
jgi:hypothetical protein